MRRALLTILILLLVATGLLLAASRGGLIPQRYDPFAPIDLADPPNLMTGIKLWLMADDAQACSAALRRAGVAHKVMPRRSDRPGCTREDTVMVSQFSRARFNPEEMKCDIALRLYLLERHDLQPLARRHLGSEIDRIAHFGSYSCRTIARSSRMSEHATADAFDISGFRLADGRTISLKTHWARGDAPALFLRQAGIRACLLFNMVLGPDYNAAHADHFHVDMGWFMGCH